LDGKTLTTDMCNPIRCRKGTLRVSDTLYPVSTNFIYLIYINKTILFVPVSLFNAPTAKFCTDLHTNLGKVLNTSMTSLTLGYSKLQNLSRSLEKKLCFTKNALNFLLAELGLDWLAFIYIKDCLYLCPSFTRELPYQPPPNFEQTKQVLYTSGKN